MQQLFLRKYNQIYKNILFLWSLCIFINIITFLFIYYKIHPGNKTLALHYNVLVGVQWYGKGINLYFIPAIGFLYTLINFFLYRTFKKSNEFLPLIAIFITLFSQIILLSAAVFLSQVN